jgi:hypothetical protein
MFPLQNINNKYLEVNVNYMSSLREMLLRWFFSFYLFMNPFRTGS